MPHQWLRAGAMDHGKSTFQPKPLQPTLKRPSDARLAGPPLLDLLKLGQSRRDSRSGSYDKTHGECPESAPLLARRLAVQPAIMQGPINARRMRVVARWDAVHIRQDVPWWCVSATGAEYLYPG